MLTSGGIGVMTFFKKVWTNKKQRGLDQREYLCSEKIDEISVYQAKGDVSTPYEVAQNRKRLSGQTGGGECHFVNQSLDRKKKE